MCLKVASNYNRDHESDIKHKFQTGESQGRDLK